MNFYVENLITIRFDSLNLKVTTVKVNRRPFYVEHLMKFIFGMVIPKMHELIK